jgi:FtsH-binding integral membrane protein
MNAESLARRWYLCGLTYLVIGISLGVYMGALGDHSEFPAHAHINLLGWASMCLTGLLYRSFPAAAGSALARWHFWLYQISVPVLLLGVFAFYQGHTNVEPIIGAASVVTLISVLLFWWAIFSARNSNA